MPATMLLAEDSVTIRLPEGFIPDGAAAPAPLAGQLGKYEVKYRHEDGSLVLTELPPLPPATLSLSPYNEH